MSVSIEDTAFQGHKEISGCKNATNWRTEKRWKFSNMTIDGDDINIQNLCMFVQGSTAESLNLSGLIQYKPHEIKP